MNASVVSRLFQRLGLGAVILAIFVSAASGQVPGVGTIEGRIFHPRSGEFVENARITIEGTSHETFSDPTGQYRLTNVPAGTARMKVFRTGSAVQSVNVAVGSGQTVQQNIDLADLAGKTSPEGVVKLDEFVVGASKEMDGAAIAINTQRFAPNVMNVVSADEFGIETSGGAGEVLKSLPGIAADLGGRGEPWAISINGVPATSVPISIGGFNLAQAGNSGRRVGLHQISIDTISRIEVAFTPTPETTGSALAGSINMVPRSAFERARPIYSLGTSLVMRDHERSLDRTPGHGRSPTRKINHPFDFSAIVPVNRRFGFSVSASTYPIYTPTAFMQNTWRGASAATNGAALPDTTPDKPYLTDYAVRDGTSYSRRSVLAATVDFQLSRNDRLSFSLQTSLYFDEVNNRTLTFFVNRVLPGNFSTTFTRGAAGAGEVRLNNDTNKWSDTLYMPTLTWRHDGPVWKAEVGAGTSRSTRKRLDLSHGHFNNAQASRPNVTVSFDDIFYLRPRVITVADGTTGAPIDPYRINNYFLTTANSNQLSSVALERSAFANVRRDLFWRVPMAIKAGLDVRQSMRDLRQQNPTYTFGGADGRAFTAATLGTSDDSAAVVHDQSFSQRVAPFGFPRIDWVSNEQLADLFQSRPNYFSVNEVTRYTRAVVLSKHAEEIISSAYVRGDVQLFKGRLKLIGGIRAEQTNDKGEGQLIDPPRNYRRDAAGRVILDANRQPVLIAPAGSLEAAQLTNVDRGLRAEKEYLRWFPSLNAGYSIRENLIARAGYFWSVGRPDFAQYAGSLTLPNTENPPGPNNRISVNNAAIKAWSARTVKVTLEYYFEGAGLVSVGAFRRDFENFFGATIFTPTPEFLGLYGLDPTIYGQYEVSTQYNLPSSVRMTGIDFNYKQPLRFLPGWARGVQVFANASAQRAIGEASDNFAGYVPRSYNFGASLSRPTFNVRAKWNYKGRARLGPVAPGRSIEPGTYSWGSKRLLLDLSGEYFLSRRFALFVNLNNIADEPADQEIAGPSTPAQAQFRQRIRYGSLWTVGLKATF